MENIIGCDKPAVALKIIASYLLMTTVNVIFYSPWSEPASYLVDGINILTPNNDGIWVHNDSESRNLRLVGVSKPHQADYVVILDRETDDSKALPNGKKIYLQREPPGYIDPVKVPNDYAYNGQYQHMHHVSIPWILKPYNVLMETDTFQKKTKGLVVICSGKKLTEGHIKRLAFLKQLSAYIDMDIYGRFHDNPEEDFHGRYCGTIEGKCKYDILSRYKFAIVCENGQHDNYFTEKIVDCFLSDVLPIYWGCPNIGDYFPRGSYITLDNIEDITSDPVKFAVNMRKIQTISKASIDKQTQASMLHAKKSVLEMYNIWPSLAHIIENLRNDPPSP